MKGYRTFLLSFTGSRTVDFEKETIEKQLIQLTWCQKFKNKFQLGENDTVLWNTEGGRGNCFFKNTARFVLTLKLTSVVFLEVIINPVVSALFFEFISVTYFWFHEFLIEVNWCVNRLKHVIWNTCIYLLENNDGIFPFFIGFDFKNTNIRSALSF